MPQISAERGNFFTGKTAASLRKTRAPAESEIALSGVSAKVKPLDRLVSPVESALRRRVT